MDSKYSKYVDGIRGLVALFMPCTCILAGFRVACPAASACQSICFLPTAAGSKHKVPFEGKTLHPIIKQI
jgi:hypothetical protein